MKFEQIRQNERLLTSALTEFKNLFDEFYQLSNRQLQEEFEIKNHERQDILNKLYAYLINGFSLEQSKQAILNDYNGYNIKMVTNLINVTYNKHLSQIKPHKVYAAHKLHDAGLNNKKIAELLEITPQTVTKYLLLKLTI